MSRRHAAGAESARGLLFTVLGEFVLPHQGTAWTSTIIDVLARVGVEEKASRQALMRTAGGGWLESERIGRRTRWRLTTSGHTLLTEGANRIYGFTGPTRDWDGKWLLALARTPDADRKARHLLHTRMMWGGFGSPAPGVWISTHSDRAKEAQDILDQAGTAGGAHLFVAEYRGDGDLKAMVGQAWDLAALDADYRSFGEEFATGSRPDPVGRLVELVHAWRRFPWIDPTLPIELLPRGWNGIKAVETFARRHGAWAPTATSAWLELDQQQP
jgi:phenylacetic acid degradation operon negative regulatory protein